MPDTKEDPQTLQVPIYFTPREIKKYSEVVKLDFNGLYNIDLTITGEGIPMNLELKDPDQAYLDFGIVSVGGDVTRTVPLINKSKKPVKFKLSPSNVEQFKKCNLSFTNDNGKEIILKPREVLPIEIRFQPKIRLPNFNLDILLNMEFNEPRKLIQI